MATLTWAQSVVLAPMVELIAAKLAALIRMNDDARFGPSAPHRHHERIQHQDCLHSRARTPPLVRADVRGVRHPYLVWLVILELTLGCAVSTQHLPWPLAITAHAAKRSSHCSELSEPCTY